MNPRRLLDILILLFLLSAAAFPAAAADPVLILTSHIGYDAAGAKKAVIRGEGKLAVTRCELLDAADAVVLAAEPTAAEYVDHWQNWFFQVFDFSSVQREGTYRVRVVWPQGEAVSAPFAIAADLFLQRTFSDVLFHFKTQRSSGRFERADHAVPFFGGRRGTVDVHGGWYDASGDTSKYLSHLTYTNTLCPQQAPLTVWALLQARERLARRPDFLVGELPARIVDEACYGADFLVRMQDPAGYFYTTVFDQWSKDVGKRMICAYSTQDGIRSASYQAAYREGGGVAIAALARCSALGVAGDFTPQRYWQAAVKGFHHLEKNNRAYLDDGRENIIDDYCALLAATELYAVKPEADFLAAARRRAASLTARLAGDGLYHDWWRSDDAGREPFYHGSDAGLPVVALLRFVEVCAQAPEREAVLAVVKRSLNFELAITTEVFNPFGYARQYFRPTGERTRTAFFLPHLNPSGYWWQGENARLASLAAAARLAAPHFSRDPAFRARLRRYADDQLQWIVGLNPFDICMLHGHGRNNPVYDPGYDNAPGGIANGITSGFRDEDDIDFLPPEIRGMGDHTWRWTEQWLSHPTWYLVAVSSVE